MSNTPSNVDQFDMTNISYSTPQQSQPAPLPQQQQKPYRPVPAQYGAPDLHIFRYLPFVFLILAIVMLAIKTAPLGLLKLDHIFIFPSLVGNYMEHFQEYTRGYGLTWPLHLAYLYGIFSLYLVNAGAAHIVLFAVHALGSLVLYRLFSRQFSSGLSALFAGLFLVFPFFAEQYGWFSAGSATLVHLLIFLQLVIASKSNMAAWVKLVLLMVLQILAVSLHETAFYTFIPVALLAGVSGSGIFSISGIISMLLLAVPSVVYTALRSFVYTAQYEGVTRDFTLGTLTDGTMVSALAGNVTGFIKSIQFLFFVRGPLEVYWLQNLTAGIGSLPGNILLFIFAVLTTITLIVVIANELRKGSAGEMHMVPLYVQPLFWVIIGVTALLPNLLKSPGVIAFDTLALPFFSLLLAFLLFVVKEIRVAGVVITGILVVIFSFSTLRILNLMEYQAIDDERHFIQLVEGVLKEQPGNEPVAVQIQDLPFSTRTIMTFGEYMRTCSSYDWCLLAATNRRTNRIPEVYINETANSELPVVKFTYNPETRDLVLNSVLEELRMQNTPPETTPEEDASASGTLEIIENASESGTMNEPAMEDTTEEILELDEATESAI